MIDVPGDGTGLPLNEDVAGTGTAGVRVCANENGSGDNKSQDGCDGGEHPRGLPIAVTVHRNELVSLKVSLKLLSNQGHR